MPSARNGISIANLARLKSTELKTLAQLIGSNHSGTKNELATRIFGTLEEPTVKHASQAVNLRGRWSKSKRGEGNGQIRHDNIRNATLPRRILSIDMGVRNLAYCMLDVHPSQTQIGLQLPQPSHPHPMASFNSWSRLSISSLPVSSLASVPKPSPSTIPDPFSLPSLSHSAYTLISDLVLTPKAPNFEPPDTVLIERQRWRSMGSAAVQQWTVRVNTLEAMLWATLISARERGDWKGDVYGVDPGRVARWWTGSLPEAEGTKKGAKEGKKEKVTLVRRWLENREMVEVDGEAEKTRRMFLSGGESRRKRKAEKNVDAEVSDGHPMVGDEVKKWDDLADCLLQGVAWVQWENNKQLLLERGPNALLGELG